MYRSTGGAPDCLIHAISVSRAGASSGLVPALRTPLPVSAFPNRPGASVIAPPDVAVKPLPDESGVVAPEEESRCLCRHSGATEIGSRPHQRLTFHGRLTGAGPSFFPP